MSMPPVQSITPFYIQIVMGIYVRPCPPCQYFPRSQALGQHLVQMLSDDMITESDSNPPNSELDGRWFDEKVQGMNFNLTERGRKYVEMLLSTPLPVSHTEWKDPRFIEEPQ